MTRLCRLLDVTRAGYYAWRQRPTSRRQEQDRVLLEAMRAIFERSGGTYGSPRVHRALMARGYRLSRRRVERLMRTGGWRARVARVYRRKAGTHRWFGQHPNHGRRTHAMGPDQIWVGDLTYLAVAGRWWYLATVWDQYSRRLLAWRLSATRDSGLTRAVVDAARPARTRTSSPYFHSLKADVIHGRSFHTVVALRQQLRRYVRFYNYQRLHSSLDSRPPVDYEHGAAWNFTCLLNRGKIPRRHR